jgi:hypothetical protein
VRVGTEGESAMSEEVMVRRVIQTHRKGPRRSHIWQLVTVADGLETPLADPIIHAFPLVPDVPYIFSVADRFATLMWRGVEYKILHVWFDRPWDQHRDRSGKWIYLIKRR